MIDATKNMPKSEKSNLTLNPDDKDQKTWRYWMSCIERAKKAQRTDAWNKARDRYKAKSDESSSDQRPFVNDLRKHHESVMSFLDQQEPTFKITPADAFLPDMEAQKQAECDFAYLKKVWNEQKCQQAQSRKLDSACLTNNGFTLVQFDIKKWMPTLRFLKNENVLIDSTCEGIIENANWMGYWEIIALEEFRSWHPDIDEKIFKHIADKAGSELKEEERQQVILKEGDAELFKTVCVYHIYARNAAAIRKLKESEDEKVEIPKPRLAEELQMNTPRRYLQLVDNYKGPIVNESKWPFNLDHEEFPITHLQFNDINDLYGFTDYQQMERTDELGDNVLADLQDASYWAAATKFAGATNLPIEEADIRKFLDDRDQCFLPNMLDPDSKNPKVKAIDRGRIDPAQINVYELIHTQAKEASLLSELLQTGGPEPYKDVTALAARIADANMHQRVNRRLGGPWGYEKSICEDAVKMLEVAHQFVPRVSSVAVIETFPITDEITDEIISEEQREVLKDLAWPEALMAIAQGGQLIKLGIDAIVGPELAKYWSYKMPAEHWRLSTKVTVEPGTTRSITREQQAAILKQLYVEVFRPFYERTGQYHLMRQFLEMIGRIAQVPNIESLLPAADELQRQQQIMQAAQSQQIGQAGGQPLNTAQASGGEIQIPRETMPVV